jgi:hypothetical protein
VLDACDRQKAISNLVRVAKPGAPIFVSVISRLSLLVYELIALPEELEMPFYDNLRDTGDYAGGYGFTACHFFLPEELLQAFHDQPVTILELIGLEGIAAHHDCQINRLAKNPIRWQKWLQTHYQTCTHPASVGMSEHFMLICRKDQ